MIFLLKTLLKHTLNSESPKSCFSYDERYLKEAIHPTNVTNNMGTNTKINTSSKGTATRKVTDAKGNTTTKVRTASGKEYVKVKNAKGQEYKTPTPAKKKTATVTPKKVETKKEPVKKVEVKKVAVKTKPKKVEVKQSVSTPTKSAESSVSPALSSAIAKSTPTAPKISSETKAMMDDLSKSSSTSAPAEQKLGDRIRAKFAETVAKRRERKAAKDESKSKMQKGGAIKRPVSTTKPSSKRYVDSKIKMTGPSRPVSKPMIAQKGGPVEAMQKAMGQKPVSTRKTMKYVRKKGSGYIPSTESNKPDRSKWAEKYASPNAKRMQKGGGMSDVKSGVKQVARGVKKGITNSVNSAKSVAKTAIKATPQYQAYKATGKAAKNVDDALEKRYPNYTGKGSMYAGLKSGAKTLFGYKTGGMVNPNAAVKRQAVAGSKGVRAGVNPKASASSVARGRVGGTSAAPKTATPKAKYGMSLTKMKK